MVVDNMPGEGYNRLQGAMRVNEGYAVDEGNRGCDGDED